MAPESSREDPVLSRLRSAASRGALSHALLFTGPGDRLAAARFAAAAFQCTGGNRPCGVCPACRTEGELIGESGGFNPPDANDYEDTAD